MFKILKIETEEHLRLLQNESKSALFNSIQNVHYPTSLRGNGNISNWSKKYKEIDKLNKILVSSQSVMVVTKITSTTCSN